MDEPPSRLARAAVRRVEGRVARTLAEGARRRGVMGGGGGRRVCMARRGRGRAPLEQVALLPRQLALELVERDARERRARARLLGATRVRRDVRRAPVRGRVRRRAAALGEQDLLPRARLLGRGDLLGARAAQRARRDAREVAAAQPRQRMRGLGARARLDLRRSMIVVWCSPGACVAGGGRPVGPRGFDLFGGGGAPSGPRVPAA